LSLVVYNNSKARFRWSATILTRLCRVNGQGDE